MGTRSAFDAQAMQHRVRDERITLAARVHREIDYGFLTSSRRRLSRAGWPFLETGGATTPAVGLVAQHPAFFDLDGIEFPTLSMSANHIPKIDRTRQPSPFCDVVVPAQSAAAFTLRQIHDFRRHTFTQG